MADTTITRENMWEPLFKAEPELQPAYYELLREEDYRSGETPGYGFTSHVAQYVVTKFEQDDAASVRRVLDVAELWLRAGDDDVRELACVGLIEDLTNGRLYSKLQPEDIVPSLPEGVREEWLAIRGYWLENLPKFRELERDLKQQYQKVLRLEKINRIARLFVGRRK